jgi:hypothetical protein
MARRTTTYAIRLAVEGGGQVKAELVSVGQSGEQSLKRIESAGDRASGGLRALAAKPSRCARRSGHGWRPRRAGRDRSLSTADAISETASKIGVGVEALQELRFAASLAGVEQQTLDMALQRFVRRVAEAANGTGEAEDALAQMGIALRDQSGNLRRSENRSVTSPMRLPASRTRPSGCGSRSSCSTPKAWRLSTCFGMARAIDRASRNR